MNWKLLHSVLLIFALFMVKSSIAQQDPMYSMYMFDKMLINPAYTGSSDWAVGTVKHRTQFAGMEGSPSTQTLNFHLPISRRKIGLGIKVINDNIAVMNNLNASLFYAYHLNFGGGKLSMGVETGIYNRTINYSDLVLTELGDNAIPLTSTSSLVPDASWGLYYQKKQFYAGLAHQHLLPVKFKDHLAGESNSRLYTHFNLVAGNVFDLNKKWSIEPSFLLKSVKGAPMQLDLNTLVYYKDIVGVGLHYRTGDAVAGIFRANITENIRVSYSYDVTVSNLSTYSGGAHEIILSYGIKLAPPAAEKETHPRFYY